MGILSSLILLLIGVLVLHLLEEVKTGFRKRLPFGGMPRSIFIGINAFVYLFCFITLSLSLVGNDLAFPFAWIFAIGMAINGFGHIGIMIFRRKYFPGGLTAFLILPVTIYLMIHLVGI